jgi:hypothetical protein
MYQWYQEAAICYAFLDDVSSAARVIRDLNGRLARPVNMIEFEGNAQLRNSAWFTRGWTLQELVAPEVVEFYAADWTLFGTKASLSPDLAEISGIDVRVLDGAEPSICNVAERMSWAAFRSTTRPEDQAYSLLGIFGVHMPLLYGEGKRAFQRLQEEILKLTEDYTILAWGMRIATHLIKQSLTLPLQAEPLREAEARLSPVVKYELLTTGPLASNALSFQSGLGFAALESCPESLYQVPRPFEFTPPAMTSRGLRLCLLLRQCGSLSNVFFGYINCRLLGTAVCVLLKRSSYRADCYSRVGSFFQEYAFLAPETLSSFVPRSIYLLRHTETEIMPRLPFEPEDVATLVVNSHDIRYFLGWLPEFFEVLRGDDIGRRLNFHPRDPHIFRCLYRNRIWFIVALGRGWCGIISADSMPRELRGLSPFRDGSWNREHLKSLREYVEQSPGFFCHLPEAVHDFGEFSFSAACTRDGRRVVFRLNVIQQGVDGS